MLDVVTPSQATRCRRRDRNSETDSLRFYMFGREWRRRVEHIGSKSGLDMESPLIL